MGVEVLIPIALFVMITVSVGMISQLIATGMLNKTIREAMRSDPGSVPLLAAKLDERQPWADSLLGWLLLVLALVLVALALFEHPLDRPELFKAASVAAILGATVLIYLRFVRSKAP